MNVLALGAHPDDIEYGCGGTLSAYAEKGHNVFLFVASDGSLGGDAAVRKQEQEYSALVMGARQLFWGGYRDTEVPLNRELIVQLEDLHLAARIRHERHPAAREMFGRDVAEFFAERGKRAEFRGNHLAEFALRFACGACRRRQ